MYDGGCNDTGCFGIKRPNKVSGRKTQNQSLRSYFRADALLIGQTATSSGYDQIVPSFPMNAIASKSSNF